MTLSRDDIETRLSNAHLARAEAHHQFLTVPCGPSDVIPRDDAGRTPQDAYHYWCGVVDVYTFLVSVLDEKDYRAERDARYQREREQGSA